MLSYGVLELVNTPQFVKDAEGAVCIGKIGYRIFAHLSEQQKISVCQYLSRHVLLVLPHTSPLILSKGCTLVGLHAMARAFIDAEVDHVIFVGYGMKAPIMDLICFAAFHLQRNTLSPV